MAYVMSTIFVPMSIGSMSHVDFKKWPCRPVEKFRVKGHGMGVPHIEVHIGVFAMGVVHIEVLLGGHSVIEVLYMVDMSPFVFIILPDVGVGLRPLVITDGHSFLNCTDSDELHFLVLVYAEEMSIGWRVTTYSSVHHSQHWLRL